MKKKERVHQGERFEPIAYQLNWPMVHDLRITITDESGSSAETTVGAILRETIPGRFTGDGTKAIPEVDDENDWFDIRTPTRLIKVSLLGDNHFPAQVLDRVLRLWRMENGTDYRAQLFFYDSEDDSYEATWWERFKFFVVVGDDIVDESFELSSLCEHDIDEKVLKPAWYFNDEDDKDDESWKTPGEDTGFRWWYGRFYTETKAGRLMIMRTDAPRIFHYEPPEHRESANAKHLGQIARATSWIALVVGVLATLSLLRLIFGRG